MKGYALGIYGLLGAPFPKGWNYSGGITTIGNKLKAQGWRVDLALHGVTRYEFTNRNAGYVQDAVKRGETPILFGHSLGADELTYITAMLPNIRFPMIACIDPTNWPAFFGTGPSPVSKNVDLAFDFYQRNIQPGGGQLVAAAGSNVQIVKVECPKDVHVTIDDDPAVIKRIVDTAASIIGK